MSTVFYVYPRTEDVPTFAALLDRSNAELHRFLGSIDIGGRPLIHVRLQRDEDDSHVPFSINDPARWDKDTYAWFTIGGLAGGTDAYYDDDATAIQETWTPDVFDIPECKRLETLIHECVSVRRRWWFRRSVGQAPIVNLAYGLIAGSLAAITGGFVHSDDGAWERMPALPEDFLRRYFRPELALDEDFRAWSRECVDSIAEEL